jgi:hypothetical protein
MARNKMVKPTCSVADCDLEQIARGMCKSHYYKWYYRNPGLVVRYPLRSRKCLVDSCEKRSYARGYCNMHRLRLDRTGSIDAPVRASDLQERFWSKVDKSGPNGCWLWTASARGASGYGQFYWNGSMVGAHRVAYELCKGPVPDGLSIDHLCCVRLCVNPDHLEAVTCAENNLRRAAWSPR